MWVFIVMLGIFIITVLNTALNGNKLIFDFILFNVMVNG